jgi:hypothetical protein
MKTPPAIDAEVLRDSVQILGLVATCSMGSLWPKGRKETAEPHSYSNQKGLFLMNRENACRPLVRSSLK